MPAQAVKSTLLSYAVGQDSVEIDCLLPVYQPVDQEGVTGGCK
jgi:hypothetical protein